MSGLVMATVHLYREAFRATARSFVKGWLTAVAVTVFAGVMKEKVSRRHLQVKIQKVVKLDTYSKALPLENKEGDRI